MALVKIKLTSSILIDGKNASPEDKNKGIYEVERTVANNLIARKRAVLFDGKVETPKPPANNNPSFDLETLKIIADTLGIKYNPSIGGQKLNERILAELQTKAEELKVDICGLDAIKAYEVINNKIIETSGDDKPVDDITEEELRAIAELAEIELPEAGTLEEFKNVIKEAFEDYLSEEKLEVIEEETIKETWERIKAKLKENDN